jgi:hypothetical protein
MKSNNDVPFMVLGDSSLPAVSFTNAPNGLSPSAFTFRGRTPVKSMNRRSNNSIAARSPAFPTFCCSSFNSLLRNAASLEMRLVVAASAKTEQGYSAGLSCRERTGSSAGNRQPFTKP